MRKKYSNELFNFIKELGFSPNEFTLSDINSDNLSAKEIKFRDTNFVFIIRCSENSFEDFDCKYVRYNPSFSFSDYFPAHNYTNFDSILQEFKEWIEYHIMNYLTDLDEPDLWECFKNGNNSLMIDKIDFNEQSSFSVEEKRLVKLLTNEFYQLVEKELSLNKSEQTIIKDRLEYLIEATERLNKFDWKGVVISTLIGITTTLSLDTQRGQLLYDIFKRIFSNIPKLL